MKVQNQWIIHFFKGGEDVATKVWHCSFSEAFFQEMKDLENIDKCKINNRYKEREKIVLSNTPPPNLRTSEMDVYHHFPYRETRFKLFWLCYATALIGRIKFMICVKSIYKISPVILTTFDKIRANYPRVLVFHFSIQCFCSYSRGILFQLFLYF